MYSKNPLLLEFDPTTIMNQVRSTVPHIKTAMSSGKNFVKGIINAKKGQRLKQAGKQVATTIRHDPTLFGDVVRTGEALRSAASLKTIQNMAPLPTADVQSIKNVGDSFKTLISRGGNSSSAKRTALRARKVITNPVEHAKRFANDRATLSTYIGSPINNYNGIIAKTIGLSAPIIDGSATMIPLTANNITPKDLKVMIKGTKDAALGATKHAYQVSRRNIRKWLNNKKRNQRYKPLVLKIPTNTPEYNTLPIKT